MATNLATSTWTVDTILGVAPIHHPNARIPSPRTGDLSQLQGTPNSIAIARGCVAKGDGGGGTFLWDDNGSQDDDGGTFIVPGATSGGSGPGWRRLGTGPGVASGPLNVRWFGARGDTTGNDGPAIQTALELASHLPRGGRVFIPAGVYSVHVTSEGHAIRIPGKNKSDETFKSPQLVELVGEGRYSTILLLRNPGDYSKVISRDPLATESVGLLVENDPTDVDANGNPGYTFGPLIADLGVWGTFSSNEPRHRVDVGIKLYRRRMPMLERVHCQRHERACLIIDSCNISRVVGCVFFGSGSPDHITAIVNESTQLEWLHTHVAGGIEGTGIAIDRTRHFNILGGHIEGRGLPLAIGCSPEDQGSWTGPGQISGVGIENPKGSYVEMGYGGDREGHVRNVTINNCKFSLSDTSTTQDTFVGVKLKNTLACRIEQTEISIGDEVERDKPHAKIWLETDENGRDTNRAFSTGINSFTEPTFRDYIVRGRSETDQQGDRLFASHSIPWLKEPTVGLVATHGTGPVTGGTLHRPIHDDHFYIVKFDRASIDEREDLLAGSTSGGPVSRYTASEPGNFFVMASITFHRIDVGLPTSDPIAYRYNEARVRVALFERSGVRKGTFESQLQPVTLAHGAGKFTMSAGGITVLDVGEYLEVHVLAWRGADVYANDLEVYGDPEHGRTVLSIRRLP